MTRFGPLHPYTPDAVAEFLATKLDQAAVERGRATLAVPGGRSPGPVLTALAAQCSPFLRERLHLCWVDERGVPVGHGDRNDGAMLAAWDAGGPRPAYVHPMPAEQEDLEAAADAYAATLTDIGAGEGFDAVLLGIGEDGHIASLFPDHPLLDDLGVCAAIADSPKPPPRRLTVSLPVLAGSGSLVVLVLGAGKAEAMGTALAGPNRTVPVSLLPTDATQIFVDDGCLGALGPV